MATSDWSQLLDIEFPGVLMCMGMRSTWFGTKLFYLLSCNNKSGRCQLVYGCGIAEATRWLIMRIPHLSDDTIFWRQHPKLDPSIGSRIRATKVRHSVSYNAMIFISTTHKCYDCLSSPIHPRDRHLLTKYRIMGLGHEVLARDCDAVLTSGLDGEVALWGTHFGGLLMLMIWHKRYNKRNDKRSGSYVEAYRSCWRQLMLKRLVPTLGGCVWVRTMRKISIMFGQWALIDQVGHRVGGEMNLPIGIALVQFAI
jgi:hypothetical protein